jgi:hypothetical protein
LSAQNYFPTLPSQFANDSFSSVPFSAGTNTAGRFQEVYDASGFTSLAGDRPFWIHRISFREDENHQFGFSSSFTDIEISLSTTPRLVDGLSAIFTENVGLDNTTIVGRGPFQIGQSSAAEFSVSIFLSEPFYYDPSRGNLLLDVRNFGGGRTSYGVPPFSGPAYVDASGVTGDTISSVYADSVNAISGIPSTLGLVTQFYITPVPEPSALSLLGLGALTISACWRRRRRL